MNKALLLVALLICAASANICHSWGDPHNRLLNGRSYDIYDHQGDFLFFRYKGLEVQERISHSQSWGRRSLLIGAAVRFGRNVFEIQNNNVKLNKQPANADALKRAKVQVSGNVFTITYKKITIKIHNHSHNDRISGRNYLSLFVEVPPSLQKTDLVRMRGLCIENAVAIYARRKRSLFSTKPVKIQLPPRPPRRFTKEQRAAARKACKSTGLRSRRSIRDCVFDYLRAKNKEEVLRAYRGDAKDKKKLRKIEKKTEKKIRKQRKNKCKRRLAACNKRVSRHKTTISQLNAKIVNLGRSKEAAEKQARDARNALNRLRAQFNRKYGALRNKYNRLGRAYRAVRARVCRLTKAFDARTARFKQIASLVAADARQYNVVKRYRANCQRRRRIPRRPRGPRRPLQPNSVVTK